MRARYRIAEVARNRGIDATMIARCADVPLSSVRAFMSDDPPQVIDTRTLCRIAMVLRVDVSALIRSDKRLTVTAGMRPRHD